MKIIVPDYYNEFRCIADRCRHTCCAGWEIAIDDDTAARYARDAEIAPFVSSDGGAHFTLTADERCPFLRDDGLCRLILSRGEDVLCQTCRDHPRFRNFWTGMTELGLGMVCEAAARLILSRPEPMRLVTLSDDGDDAPLPEDEAWLFDLRERFFASITEHGARARLMEYLIYRHLPDALYDGRVENRVAFIRSAFSEITAAWDKTDGSLDALAEAARAWSYDVEYDDEELEKRISAGGRS